MPKTTRDALSEADWQAVKAELQAIMIGLARLRTTISYSALAAQVRTAVMHHRAPVFHQILREICRDELAAGRPVLGVVVVNKQTGICGAGFFKFAAGLGYDVSTPERYWQQEFERVCTYWSEA